MNNCEAAKVDDSSSKHDRRGSGINLAARERRRMKRQVSEPSYQTRQPVEDSNFDNLTGANRLRQTCPPDYARSNKEKVRSRRKSDGYVRRVEESLEAVATEKLSSFYLSSDSVSEEVQEPDLDYVAKTSDMCDETDTCTLDIQVKEDISSWCHGDAMENTCITGIVCLNDGRLILADQGNQKIKLFDSDFHPLFSTELPKPPWSLALTADNKIIVTIPDLGQYWQFGIKDKELKKELAIETESECLGIVEVMDEVIVSAYDSDKSELIAISKHGGISRKASVFYMYGDLSEEKFLLKRPNYLQKSIDNKVLYVSDVDIGLLAISVSDLRTILFIYKHTDLRCPLGVDVDRTGCIYVCGMYSHNVHQLKKTGELMRIMSRKSLTPSPQCVCLCRHESTMIVSLDKQYDLKCFQFC